MRISRLQLMIGASAAALAPVAAYAQTAEPVSTTPSAQAAAAPEVATNDVAAPAAPQTATAPGTPAADQAAPHNVDGLGDIVVTAQRRDQRLQDVPIALTAVTSDTLTGKGVSGTKDLMMAVPGLDFSRQASGATIFVRGVGSTNGAIGQEPSVALYVDGVYLPSPVGSLFSFNNVERVEVLKGPQGTLFGRNATGGVIQVITRDPSFTPEVQGSISYGNYNTVSGTLYATAPLTDNLTGDISFYGFNRASGWGHNLVDGTPTFKGNEWNVRSKWLWKPGTGTEVRLILDAGRTRSQEGLGWHIQPGTKGVDGSGYPGFYNTNSDMNDRSIDKSYGASLNIKQDLGFADLVSISAYRRVKGGYSLDQDATPAPVAIDYVYSETRTLTQELQLVSKGSSKLHWIAGAFYFNDKPAFNPILLYGSQLAFFGFPTAPDEFKEIIRQTTKSYAAFGEATYEIFDRTNLTAGLRWTKDDRTVNGVVTAAPFGLISSGTFDASFSKLTWRLSLDHKFSDDVMGYVSYNRGFKSGLFNLAAYQDPPVKPEVLDAYEAGLKTELFDKRLRFNISGFYYDYQNMQVAIPVPGAQRTFNAAAAELYGIDVDFSARPIPALKIDGGVNWTHSSYTKFPGGPIVTPLPGGGAATTSGDLAGNTLVHAPKFTANISADYTLDLGDSALDFVASYSYNSGFFWYPDNFQTQPKTNIVNASIGWTAPSKTWGIDVWGRNLLGEKYYSFVSELSSGYMGSPAEPRTYGATLRFSFK